MALSRNGIAQIRTKTSEMKVLVSSLKGSLESVRNVLTENGNYQYFKTGTDKGTDVDDNLNSAINILLDSLVPEFANVSSAMESYCAQQEELNKRLELEKETAGVDENNPALDNN